MAVTIEDVFIALSYPGMPKTCIKNMPNGFMIVPFDIKKSRHKDYEPWQYAFVNRDKKMYKIRFDSFDDLIDTLFNVKEICYGAYSQDAKPNPLYGKSIEYLKIEKKLCQK
ncbi:MAG: hypothetical protein J6W16_06510 [Methanobrevibacter sp.]|nr:hypothetical protein [Methanobrevibacter sp.]